MSNYAKYRRNPVKCGICRSETKDSWGVCEECRARFNDIKKTERRLKNYLAEEGKVFIAVPMSVLYVMTAEGKRDNAGRDFIRAVTETNEEYWDAYKQVSLVWSEAKRDFIDEFTLHNTNFTGWHIVYAKPSVIRAICIACHNIAERIEAIQAKAEERATDGLILMAEGKVTVDEINRRILRR